GPFGEVLRTAGVLATGIEIPSNAAGERIHGTGTLGPERAQERQTVRREELAGGLDAREKTSSLRCTRALLRVDPSRALNVWRNVAIASPSGLILIVSVLAISFLRSRVAHRTQSRLRGRPRRRTCTAPRRLRRAGGVLSDRGCRTTPLGSAHLGG